MRDAHALGRGLVVDPCSRERRGAAPSEIFHRWTSIRNRILRFDENGLSVADFSCGSRGDSCMGSRCGESVLAVCGAYGLRRGSDVGFRSRRSANPTAAGGHDSVGFTLRCDLNPRCASSMPLYPKLLLPQFHNAVLGHDAANVS
jgi:hypothetical protein